MTTTPEYDQQGSSRDAEAHDGARTANDGTGPAAAAGGASGSPSADAAPSAAAESARAGQAPQAPQEAQAPRAPQIQAPTPPQTPTTPQGQTPQAQAPQAFSQTQPTTPLPEAAAAGGYGSPAAGDPAQRSMHAQQQPYGTAAPAGYGAPQVPVQTQTQTHPQAHHFPAAPPQDGTAAPVQSGPAQPKSRTGALLAGLAIGALLGGVVGGGVAAVVASNVTPQTVAQGGSGAITLNNPENATAISGVAAVATPSVVTLEVSSGSTGGSGSGVIYREDGYIITNAHVVTLDGAATSGAQIRVKLSDGRILDGDLVGVDPYADLAVVKVDADGLSAIQVADSDQLDVGDLTVAIGAPLNLANTVTSGVVSALNRGISVGSPLIPQDPTPQEDDGQDNGQGDGQDDGYGFPWDFRFGLPNEEGQEQSQQTAGGTVTLPVIQTDASINPGNSGGALLNGSGELIGINVAIASATSANGTAGSDGLGFAIPANLATRVADEIIAGEQPSHGLLGATVADSTQDTDEDANHAGGLLVDVTRGGAADEAGLRSGDVITAVDGVPAVDGTSVSALIRMHAGGSTITIDYTRGGEAGQTEATLGTLEW
ncbi:trypsin-like peptidase domain-containing protein [Leucobacter sp.]